jgi:DNA/RNA endonuclease YhcR with UshA esterase domain
MQFPWVAALTLCVSVFAAPALPAVIPASDAASHVGRSVTVEGIVSEVHTARSGKATFIDIGGNYPDEAFTAVIFERSMSPVGDVGGLAGKTVDVTGTIQMYEGRPEIVVSSRDQIKIR